MPLVVEDGSIVPGADSYISLADAVTFVENYYDPYDDDLASTFLGLGTTAKERTMRKAAMQLDSLYRTKWKGCKVSADQSLDWPRADVQDEDEYDIAENVIPAAIKRAQVELALRIASELAIFTDRERGGLVASERVDVIEVEYMKSAPARTVFEEVESTLRGLLKTSRSIIRA